MDAAFWSLSVEEQFYVGIPSLVKIVQRSVLIAFFLAVIAFSYATLVWLAPRGATPMVEVWVNSFVEFQFFAAGGLLALWHAGREIRLGGAARLALIGTGLALWVVAVHVCKLQDWHPISWQKLVVGYACVLIGTLALFVGVLDTTPDDPAGRALFGQDHLRPLCFSRLISVAISGPVGSLYSVVKWWPSSACRSCNGRDGYVLLSVLRAPLPNLEVPF